MKSSFKSLFLCGLYTFSLIANVDDIHRAHNTNLIPKRVSFEGSILAKMDGLHGILDAEAMSDCFLTIQKIIHLTQGILDHNTGEHIGIFEYNGKRYTLKQIVLLEQNLHKKNIAHDDPEFREFKIMLNTLKEAFEKEAAPLVEKTKNPAVKKMNEFLIAFWCDHAGRDNSLLKDFGTEREMESLDKATAREFFIFLNDLKSFLKDIMRSAPKACSAYKKECLKLEDHAIFDDFLTN